jgi:hypothetical protein
MAVYYIGSWLTRHTARSFQIISPYVEWYSATRSASVKVQNKRRERQKQEEWLLATHPEAIMGNTRLSNLLREGNEMQSSLENGIRRRPILALGRIWGLPDPNRRVPVPAVAMTVGHSGEILRVVKMDSRWRQCEALGGGRPGPSAKLLSVDDSKGREFLWMNDRDPIRQIKFASDLAAQYPIQWILVQKSRSTTILDLEYSTEKMRITECLFKVPKTESRIDHKEPIVITMANTGRSPHSDVSFNPGSKHIDPSQIAVIDESGSWSVWDIPHPLNKARFNRRGHIEDTGSRANYKPGFHGILWIGASRTPSGADRNIISDGESDEWQPRPYISNLETRSEILLVWSRRRLQVTNGTGNIYRPAFPLLNAGQWDSIWDVQISPIDHSHVFVLTSEAVFWIEIRQRSAVRGEKVDLERLISYEHGRDPEDEAMRLSVSQDGSASCLVTIHSSGNRMLDIFWFNMEPEYGLPSYRHQKTYFPAESNFPTELLAMCLAPATVENKGVLVNTSDMRRNFSFHQMLLVGENLNLLNVVSTTFTGPVPPADEAAWMPRFIERTLGKRKSVQREKKSNFILTDRLTRQQLVQPLPLNEVPKFLRRTTKAKRPPKPFEFILSGRHSGHGLFRGSNTGSTVTKDADLEAVAGQGDSEARLKSLYVSTYINTAGGDL